MPAWRQPPRASAERLGIDAESGDGGRRFRACSSRTPATRSSPSGAARQRHAADRAGPGDGVQRRGAGWAARPPRVARRWPRRSTAARSRRSMAWCAAGHGAGPGPRRRRTSATPRSASSAPIPPPRGVFFHAETHHGAVRSRHAAPMRHLHASTAPKSTLRSNRIGKCSVHLMKRASLSDQMFQSDRRMLYGARPSSRSAARTPGRPPMRAR